jgi:hypothetical protein
VTEGYLTAGLPALGGPPSCPLCRTCDEATQVWLRWFLTENHSDPTLLRSLHDSAGFCPAHNRRLLAEAGPQVMRRPLEYALRGAADRLASLAGIRDPGRRRRRRPAGSCPLCRVITERERAAGDDVAAAMVQRSGAGVPDDCAGLCFRHLVGLLPRFSEAQAAVAAEIVAGRLAVLRSEAPESLLVLAGLDADALARIPYLTAHARQLREAPHAGYQSAGLGPASRLIADLVAGSCPACRAAGREQVRYLLWLGDSLADGHPAAADLRLCSRHLLDAWHLYDDRASARTGAWLVSVVGASSHAQAVALTAAARQVLAAPRVGWRRRGGGSGSHGNGERPEEAYGAAARAMASERSCRTCRIGLDAERRQLSLLRACLLDAGVLRAVDDAHGLCLRHASVIAEDVNARPVLYRLVTQLEQAQWELDEDAAKRTWDRRHESKGREQNVWRRVPALIDGAVYLGVSDRTGHG